MKALKWVIGITVLLAVGYGFGPTPPPPELSTNLPVINTDLKALETQIMAKEATIKGLKPNNASKVVWFDSAYQKTPYSVVYLHGFSASAAEGDPIHRDFAKRYGCNLYLPRLHEHGIDNENPLLNLTPESFLNSAKEAISVAQQLGDEVIVMSTSTGTTLALYLASENPSIHSLIAYSPNIDVYDGSSNLLTMPWGLQLGRLVMGGNYFSFVASEENQKYWTTKYRIEALVTLKSLIKSTMTEEVFSKVKQPLFMGYYYKNDSLHDETVSIPRMMEMYEQLGTPENLKRKLAFPEANAHVVCSKYTSKDLESVRNETNKFAEEILKLKPIPNQE